MNTCSTRATWLRAAETSQSSALKVKSNKTGFAKENALISSSPLEDTVKHSNSDKSLKKKKKTYWPVKPTPVGILVMWLQLYFLPLYCYIGF